MPKVQEAHSTRMKLETAEDGTVSLFAEGYGAGGALISRNEVALVAHVDAALWSDEETPEDLGLVKTDDLDPDVVDAVPEAPAEPELDEGAGGSLLTDEG